jgi:predicted ATP-grasp superfamily ATP-dependent carboligase
MVDDSSTPVVVFGCFRQGGVGIVRSLGRLGAVVHCVDADPDTPAFASRYCMGRHVWDVNGAAPEESVRFLLALGERIGRRAVLIPTSDNGAMLAAEYARDLADRFIFPEVDPQLVRALCSKEQMFHLAQRHGVAVPATAFPRSPAELAEYASRARFPVLLKPIYTSLRGRPPTPIRIVNGKRDLLDAFEASEDPGQPNLMVQEYIPGPDHMTWTFNGYFDHRGECLVAFTGRKLRNFPPYFGQASLGICVRNDEVETTTIEFMKAIGYRGALDLGYRYDERDGRYKVNDINPRVGAMFRLFVGANGIDVARALYLDLTGQPVARAASREGRKWIVEDADLISAVRYWRDGRLTLREWARSLRSIDEGAYFATDDLRPVGAVLRRNARRAFAKLSGSKPGGPSAASARRTAPLGGAG